MVGQLLRPVAVFMGAEFARVFMIVTGLARIVLMLMRMGVRVFVGVGMLVFVRVCYVPVRVLVGVHVLVFVPMLVFVFMGVFHASLLKKSLYRKG